MLIRKNNVVAECSEAVNFLSSLVWVRIQPKLSVLCKKLMDYRTFKNNIQLIIAIKLI